MKAISLLQPWASLVVLGAKRYETRGWRTSHRGPLFLHASKKMALSTVHLADSEPFKSALAGVVPADQNAFALPRGVILGVVEVVDCLEMVDAGKDLLLKRGEETFYPSDDELGFGDYRPGRWAWELRVLERFSPPVPIAGHLGLWDVPAGVMPPLTFMQPASPPEDLFPAPGEYLQGR